jgi:hypothetical protein
MNISKLSRDPRAIKAVTGLSYQEFSDLAPTFAKALYEIQSERQGRRRKPGGGQKGILKTTEDELFFILFYLKTYPTMLVHLSQPRGDGDPASRLTPGPPRALLSPVRFTGKPNRDRTYKRERP